MTNLDPTFLPEDTPQKRVSDYLEANAAKLINGFDYKPMPPACKIAAAEIVALLGAEQSEGPTPERESFVIKALISSGEKGDIYLRAEREDGSSADLRFVRRSFRRICQEFQAADSSQSEDERETLAQRLWKESTETGKETCPPSWSGHWMDWYRMRADEIIARRSAEQAEDDLTDIEHSVVMIALSRFIAGKSTPEQFVAAKSAVDKLVAQWARNNA